MVQRSEACSALVVNFRNASTTSGFTLYLREDQIATNTNRAFDGVSLLQVALKEICNTQQSDPMPSVPELAAELAEEQAELADEEGAT